MSYSVVAAALDTVKCPLSGVIIDIVQFERTAFGYRLYRDNFEEFSDNNKQKIYEWLKERADFASRMSGCTVGIDIAAYSNGDQNAE